MASSLLSRLNHNLYVRELRAYGLLRFWEIFNSDADIKKVFGVKRQTFSRILRDVGTRLQPEKTLLSVVPNSLLNFNLPVDSTTCQMVSPIVFV
ncbi:hypothetical protein RvY_01855 [Ramazzottius varieornatus]|uniref:Uncharacterized protein n=1 Tax=Ramazzottius varieornatus TaxID=947166 RepID=A0A1D1UHV2_RAMVA|nr:hypothetical protein RvY_01855 [Ramazzottius varieornatus]